MPELVKLDMQVPVCYNDKNIILEDNTMEFFHTLYALVTFPFNLFLILVTGNWSAFTDTITQSEAWLNFMDKWQDLTDKWQVLMDSFKAAF